MALSSLRAGPTAGPKGPRAQAAPSLTSSGSVLRVISRSLPDADACGPGPLHFYFLFLDITQSRCPLPVPLPGAVPRRDSFDFFPELHPCRWGRRSPLAFFPLEPPFLTLPAHSLRPGSLPGHLPLGSSRAEGSPSLGCLPSPLRAHPAQGWPSPLGAPQFGCVPARHRNPFLCPGAAGLRLLGQRPHVARLSPPLSLSLQPLTWPRPRPRASPRGSQAAAQPRCVFAFPTSAGPARVESG